MTRKKPTRKKPTQRVPKVAAVSSLDLRSLIAWQQRLIDRLIEQITAMRREGFTAAPPEPQFSYAATPLPAAVLEAVEQRATEGTTLWDELITYARGEIRKERDPEQVAAAILRGGSHEEYD